MCSGEGELPEPPPKKQKVASGKAVVAGAEKTSAETSAPPDPSPATPQTLKRKEKKDATQATAPSTSASQQHVSWLVILFTFRPSLLEEPRVWLTI